MSNNDNHSAMLSRIANMVGRWSRGDTHTDEAVEKLLRSWEKSRMEVRQLRAKLDAVEAVLDTEYRHFKVGGTE